MISDYVKLGGVSTGITALGDVSPYQLRGVNPAIAAYDAGVASGAIPVAPAVASLAPSSDVGTVQVIRTGDNSTRVDVQAAPGVVYSAPVEGPMEQVASFFRVNPSGTFDAPQRDVFAGLAPMKISAPAPGGISAPQGVNARRELRGAPVSPLLTQSPGFVAGKLPAVASGVSGAQLLPGRGEVVSKGATDQGHLILFALAAVGAWLALRA